MGSLSITSKNPQAITDVQTADPHKFKLKGTGMVELHLGWGCTRDDDGTLCGGPRKRIEHMEVTHKNHFGMNPSQKVQAPLEKGDHPKLDDSPLLDADGMATCQSLIGTLQWCITPGRFNATTVVVSMSRFCIAPCEGHLERMKRTRGHPAKLRSAFINVMTDEPDHSDPPKKECNWARTTHGKEHKRKADDVPPPMGKPVLTTTHKDANPHHDLTTRRAVTGVLHFLNQTPIDWHTKKQEMVDATRGSELAAARTATQQIAGLPQAFQCPGVPIRESSHLFCDNWSFITSSALTHSPLSKRHHALACHHTREAVASNMVAFHHIRGNLNPADALSKHQRHSHALSCFTSEMLPTLLRTRSESVRP